MTVDRGDPSSGLSRADATAGSDTEPRGRGGGDLRRRAQRKLAGTGAGQSTDPQRARGFREDRPVELGWMATRSFRSRGYIWRGVVPPPGWRRRSQPARCSEVPVQKGLPKHPHHPGGSFAGSRCWWFDIFVPNDGAPGPGGAWIRSSGFLRIEEPPDDLDRPRQDCPDDRQCCIRRKGPRRRAQRELRRASRAHQPTPFYGIAFDAQHDKNDSQQWGHGSHGPALGGKPDVTVQLATRKCLEHGQ